MNTQEFISKANKIHNNKYDYSRTRIDGPKINICCRVHGEFEQFLSGHLSGKGCRKCAFDKSRNRLRLTTNEFIERARKIHGNKYDYSKVEYVDMKTIVTIVCPEHGEFKQRAGGHLNGNACYGCFKNKVTNSKNEFIEKAKEIHGGKYDYSASEYVGVFNKLKIICPIHGEFWQKPKHHLQGSGCSLCGSRKTTQEFIIKARQVHGGKYDYSESSYVKSDGVVRIICPDHGEFEQTAHNHLAGCGCPDCGFQNSVDGITYGVGEFIKLASKFHNNKYDYSLINNYENLLSVVPIVCPKHGRFEQRAKNHLKYGCKLCAYEITVSSGHQEIIDYIKSLTNNKIMINTREAVSPHELDIYIPENKFAIEYHGIYYHSYNRQETIGERNNHKIKHQRCLDNGIKLYQIFENEWLEEKTKNIIKSKIKINLGQCNVIYARKCEIRELDNAEYKEFIDKYHMQGYRGSSVRIGLFYDKELMLAMSFNKHPKYDWEITRIASKFEHVIIGGASKLLKYFIRKHNPKRILTYADRRYSDGNLYKQLGFDLDGVTDPNYFYVKSGKLFSRQQFQKHKLKDKLEQFDPTQSESANMFNNGYRRMWDAGHYRFLINNNQYFIY